MKKNILTLCFLVINTLCFSQAGSGVFYILDLPMDARSISLGGDHVSLKGDINLAVNNPSLLSEKTHNMITLNYANYVSDINFGSVGYTRNINKRHNWGVFINFLDFGNFQGYDNLDNFQGKFTAKDMVLSGLYSYDFGKYFSVGGAFKAIYSKYERYSSFGLATDIGLNYNNDDILLDFGLSIRNIGAQLTKYSYINGKGREKLPLNIVFGLSKKLKNAPLRFSATFHNLQQFNLNYVASDSYRTNNTTHPIKWYDMMFRHTIFSVEVLPTDYLFFSTAFNYRHRAEMVLPSVRTIAGFSFGAGLKVKGFELIVALTQQQVGNMTYHFTISTDLKHFGVK